LPYNNEICLLINGILQKGNLSDSRFSGAQYHGLTYETIEKDSNEKAFPSEYKNGNFEQVTVDNNYPLVLWHKLLGKRYDKVTGEQQFGGHLYKTREVTQGYCVVFANRDVIRVTQENLEALVALGFPNVIDPELVAPYQMDYCEVNPTGSSLITAAIWAQEFKGAELPITPENYLVRIDYQVITTFRNNCIKICDC